MTQNPWINLLIVLTLIGGGCVICAMSASTPEKKMFEIVGILFYILGTFGGVSTIKKLFI